MNEEEIDDILDGKYGDFTPNGGEHKEETCLASVYGGTVRYGGRLWRLSQEQIDDLNAGEPAMRRIRQQMAKELESMIDLKEATDGI